MPGLLSNYIIKNKEGFIIINIQEERIKTNLLMLDYFDMWDEFTYKSINDTKTMRYYNLITNLIDDQIDASIRWLDSKEAEQYFKGETAYQQEVFHALEDEWDEILEAKYSSVEALLSEVYRRGKAKGYSDMRSRIRYTEQDKLALQFARDYNFGLIQRLNDDTIHQIKNTIISGFLAGDHPNRIAPKILNVAEERLTGSTFSPKQRAVMIARTEISRVQNTGILQSYINEGYTEVKILTAGDDNVCTICLSYAFQFNKDSEITYENRGSEKVHNIIKLIQNGQFPPFHPLCRCTYMSVWKSKGEPPKNPYVVCLMPRANAVNVPSDLRDSFETVVNFTQKELEEKLKDIIDSEDMDELLELFNDFKNGVYNTSYEWGAGICCNGNVQNTFSSWIKDNIYIGDILLDCGKNKGIKSFIHSHPFTTSPLASTDDYLLFAFHKIKYGIVTNEFGTMIIKSKNVSNNLKNWKKIKEISRNIEQRAIDDFGESILNSRGDPEKLSENEYDRKFHVYVRNNHDKYYEKYQKELDDYFTIKFICPTNDN